MDGRTFGEQLTSLTSNIYHNPVAVFGNNLFRAFFFELHMDGDTRGWNLSGTNITWTPTRQVKTPVASLPRPNGWIVSRHDQQLDATFV